MRSLTLAFCTFLAVPALAQDRPAKVYEGCVQSHAQNMMVMELTFTEAVDLILDAVCFEEREDFIERALQAYPASDTTSAEAYEELRVDLERKTKVMIYEVGLRMFGR